MKRPNGRGVEEGWFPVWSHQHFAYNVNKVKGLACEVRKEVRPTKYGRRGNVTRTSDQQGQTADMALTRKEKKWEIIV
jgi:hypothetical protein